MSTPGGNASFFCITSGNNEIAGIKWFLNGEAWSEPNLVAMNVTPRIIDSRIGTLQFSGLSVVQNMTSIKCVVNFRSTQSGSSNIAKLVLQG